MRVPNISLYNTANYQLNKITNNLKDANEVVSTNKQINAISDDPIGLSQVLDLRSTLNNLEQLDKNIDFGMTWINSTESALDSASDQLLDAKILCTQLANASVSASDRADAVGTIDGIIDQMLALGNTRINGSYVFSGTKTNVIPFTYDDNENPTRVIYNGNDTAFSIKTSGTGILDVGRVGREVFTEDEIAVDSTNNKLIFQEDPGMGENSKLVLEATIPDGTYTPDKLAIVVRNAMNSASKESGYSITYNVDHDAESNKFTISDDGKYDGFFQVDLLWESDDNSIGPDLGFNSGDISSAPPVEGEALAWGIFETLFALKGYLASDDVEGISRTMTRLDTHYNSMTSTLSDIGNKYNSLEITQQISSEAQLSLTERKSMIEDADIIEAIMNLTAIQTAYEASLSSTSKIIGLSLVDYL